MRSNYELETLKSLTALLCWLAFEVQGSVPTSLWKYNNLI